MHNVHNKCGLVVSFPKSFCEVDNTHCPELRMWTTGNAGAFVLRDIQIFAVAPIRNTIIYNELHDQRPGKATRSCMLSGFSF